MSDPTPESDGMRPVPVRARPRPASERDGRVDAVKDGRFGIQQYAAIRGVEVWTFATISCGYERLEDAIASIRGLQNYRVADRTTGHPVTGPGQWEAEATPHIDGGWASDVEVVTPPVGGEG